MREPRTSDLLIVLGHMLQCHECRQRLFVEPERLLIGRKLSDDEREKLLSLQAKDFEDSAALADTMGLELATLVDSMNHPRARLRHL